MELGTYGKRDEDSRKVFDWMRLLAPKVIMLVVICGLIGRIIIPMVSPTPIGTTFLGWLQIIGLGILNDACFAVFELWPAMLIYIFLNDEKYHKTLGWILLLLMIAATIYAFYPQNAFSSYSPWVNTTLRIAMSVITVGFGLRLFVPAIRKPWRAMSLTLVEFCYVLLTITELVCGIIFWYHFGARFNFIAVDRLLYSKNALRASMEGLPVVPIIILVTLVAIFVTWKMFRRYRVGESNNMGHSNTIATLILYLILGCASCWWLDYGYRKIGNTTLAAKELQENGSWNLLEACRSGHLEYYRFYPTIPTNQANNVLDSLLATGTEPKDSLPKIKRNLVVITLESIDFEYITESLCPFMDSLARNGLAFTNMYACGSSMSKGIDALTLCVPPTPGRSIVNKFGHPISLNPLLSSRKEKQGLPTTGRLLQSEGYATAFIYGGNGRRANLNRYFEGNGYEVMDKHALKKITYENSMGACDDDTYRQVLDYADKRADLGKPFHIHVLTLSSHSPYSYPGSRLVVRNHREEAVRYTDEALGRFFESAKGKSWFKNTIFVITSNRGSEKSGEVGPKMKDFHIPAIVYSPGFVHKERVDKFCSQIDLMPTVLAMMHIGPYEDFYGRNVLNDDFIERSFVSNYLQMGYFKDSTLTVLQPMKSVKAYRFEDDMEVEMETPDSAMLKEAQAVYQSISQTYK